MGGFKKVPIKSAVEQESKTNPAKLSKEQLEDTPIVEFLEGRFDKYELHRDMQPDHIVLIDPDEEVYLLQAPKSYNVKELIGKKIQFGKRTKLPHEGDATGYEITLGKTRTIPRQVAVADEEGKPIMLVVKPQGSFILRESTHNEKESDEGELEAFLNRFNEEHNGTVLDVASNLKVRHPLLGSEYFEELSSRTLSLNNLAQKIKREATEEPSPKKSKKRKHDQTAEVPSQKKKRKNSMSELQWLQNI